MASPFSFDFPPGTVLTDRVPEGLRAMRRSVDVGPAAELTARGADVLDWVVQRRSGIAVRTPGGRDAPAVREGFEGSVVIRLARVGVLSVQLAAPMRVTLVLREPDAIGFAYGTLRGHPEVGEESFVVRRVGDRAVFELRSLSRPAFPYSLVAPAGRLLQARYARRYLRTFRRSG